jgi:hypothetical protein
MTFQVLSTVRNLSDKRLRAMHINKSAMMD